MRRIKRKPMAAINVVPYIDVMLVLLVIFMVTAPLLSQGVEVNLPRVGGKPTEQGDKEPVIVSINANGQYFINYGANKKDPIALGELATRVSALLKYSPGTKFYVRSDEAVPYGQVVSLMVAMQKAGVPAVGLMTDPLEQ